MNTIIIEDKAYSISNKELKELQKRSDTIDSAEKYHDKRMAEMDLDFYLTEKKKNYKSLGLIMFDYRL